MLLCLSAQFLSQSLKPNNLWFNQIKSMTKRLKIIFLIISIFSLGITLVDVNVTKAADEPLLEADIWDSSCPTGPEWLSSIGIRQGLLIPCECLTSQKDCPTGTEADKANCKVRCNLNSMFQMIVNFSKLILAVTGSAALLMFIFGGLMFILAAGNQERIQKGKTAMASAAIGLAIILGAWLIVNTTILVLSQGKVGGDSAATIFGKNWSQQP